MALLALAAVPALAQEASEGGGAFLDPDWSVGLRGTFTTDSDSGPRYEAIVAPEVAVTRHGLRDETSLSAGAEIAVDQDRNMRLSDLHASADTAVDLDAVTGLKGSLDLSLMQPEPTDSSLPADTLVPPLEFTGTAVGSVSRQFGRFDVTGTLTGERYIKGPTTLADNSVLDNSHQNYWLGSGTLRLGFELTPLISIFGEAEEADQKFDAPSPSIAAFLDNRTTTLRGGISYKRDGTIQAEASIGRAWVDYADTAITDRPAWVANANVSVTPDETLTLTGALETSLGPSDNVAGDTDVDYELTGEAKYVVNPWLTLRGSAGASRTVTLGSGDVDWGYTAGAGLDWQTARHVAWSADYLFSHDDSSTNGVLDRHTVTVGMTVKK